MRMRMHKLPLLLLAACCVVASLLAPVRAWPEANGAWLRRVPDEYKAMRNPYQDQAQGAVAGRRIFEGNCAKCHGADANGRTTRPSLRSERIHHATDGQIFWMLKNGNPYQGMPSWSSLPEQQRWQVIAYLRTLAPGRR